VLLLNTKNNKNKVHDSGVKAVPNDKKKSTVGSFIFFKAERIIVSQLFYLNPAKAEKTFGALSNSQTFFLSGPAGEFLMTGYA